MGYAKQMLMQQLAATCGACRKRLEMLSGEGPALLTCVLASRRPSTPFTHEIHFQRFRSLLLRLGVAETGVPLQCQPGRRKRKENSRRRRRIAPPRLRPPPLPPSPPPLHLLCLLRLLLCPRTTPVAPAPPWLLGRNQHRRTHGAVMITMLPMPATATIVVTVAIADTTTNKDNKGSYRMSNHLGWDISTRKDDAGLRVWCGVKRRPAQADQWLHRNINKCKLVIYY